MWAQAYAILLDMPITFDTQVRHPRFMHVTAFVV